MSLYNCKSDGDQYRISKFTNDLNVEASYLTDGAECDCPAGHRPACRHRIMLARFIAKDAIAGQWFHNYEANQWIRAMSDDEPNTLGDLSSAASELTIASSISFLDDVSGDELANAFAGLLHNSNDPKPINLLELAKPTVGLPKSRFIVKPKPEGKLDESKPLRRL